MRIEFRAESVTGPEVAAVAVLASLVFVGIQMRMSAEQQRLALRSRFDPRVEVAHGRADRGPTVVLIHVEPAVPQVADDEIGDAFANAASASPSDSSTGSPASRARRASGMAVMPITSAPHCR